MGRYVALLRGINVGGKNIIKMSALAACFEAHGFTAVTTYIQSGNVVFESSLTARAGLIGEIEVMLAQTFGYAASVAVRSRAEMTAIVERAPRGFGAEPATYRYDVLFLKPPLTAAAAIKLIPGAPGVDQAHAGTGVIYASRLVAKAAQSRLDKLAAMPIYQQLTVRNWNTTTALAGLTKP